MAVVLRAREGQTEVLLLRRSSRAGDPWSGHVSFPGGMHDPADPDLLHTATREAAEEVGIALDPTADLLGELDEQRALTHSGRCLMAVRPHVFLPRGDLAPQTSTEALEVFWFPLEPAAAGRLDSRFRFPVGGVPIPLRCWRFEGHVVWGLTYRMLRRLVHVAQAAPG